MSTAVVIALADIGHAMPLEEQLAAAGLAARWDQALAAGPCGDTDAGVVIVDADHLGARLPDVVGAWRALAGTPAIVALGSSAAAREHAPHARVTLLATTAKTATVVAAIHDATRLRLTAGMDWSLLRCAVGLAPVANTPAAWQPTLVAARSIELDIPRAALGWHVQHYVTPSAMLDALREDRLLTIPELRALALVDGTRTVRTIVESSPLDPQQCARLLWTLGSMGALDFTPEVRDTATAPRRTLAELRAHLRARMRRLESSTFYDVLEITPLAEYPEIEDAYERLARRFAPRVLAAYDLGTLARHVQPMWDLVEKARAVLVDDAQRGRYHDWLRQKDGALRTVWAISPGRVAAAAEAFARGQHALGAGDAHKAMSELAAACRQFPGHPEYEANLAWARYRVQVASGKDRVAAALAERETVESCLSGCRPWPRALVALALLDAAAGDADSARWHLHAALAVDPQLPAAVALARRLGLRA